MLRSPCARGDCRRARVRRWGQRESGWLQLRRERREPRRQHGREHGLGQRSQPCGRHRPADRERTTTRSGRATKEDDAGRHVGDGSIPNSKADLARFGSRWRDGRGDTRLPVPRLGVERTHERHGQLRLRDQRCRRSPISTTLGPKTLVRTVNDLLINYAFQGGSSTPTLTLRKWTGIGLGHGDADQQHLFRGCGEQRRPSSDTLGVLRLGRRLVPPGSSARRRSTSSVLASSRRTSARRSAPRT